MPERRQAHRREPIEVVMESGKVFKAFPLPWLLRDDLGQQIVQQSAELFNEGLRMYVDPETKAPQLEALFTRKLSDPVAVLRVMYPDEDIDQYAEFTYDEIVELMVASLDVNKLEKLRPLVDPNFPTPTPIGGLISSAKGIMTEDGLKMESSPDSSSLDSTEPPS